MQHFRFKFTLIYLLHVLFVLKVEGNFEKKKKVVSKDPKHVIFFIYSIYIDVFEWLIIISVTFRKGKF
jgi:hypothetical protein